MPHELLKHLDQRAAKVIRYRQILASAPQFLERAESTFRMFKTLRDKIFDAAPAFYEMKGISSGVKHVVRVNQVHKDRVRKEIEDEKLDPDVGKPIVKELSLLDVSIVSEADLKREEMVKAGGKIDGFYASAEAALDAVEQVIQHFEGLQRAEDEDEDWSGRGTSNGQRPVAGNGMGDADVTDLAAAREKKNGKKKTSKKKATRKPRVKKTKAEESPPPAEG